MGAIQSSVNQTIGSIVQLSALKKIATGAEKTTEAINEDIKQKAMLRAQRQVEGRLLSEEARKDFEDYIKGKTKYFGGNPYEEQITDIKQDLKVAGLRKTKKNILALNTILTNQEIMRGNYISEAERMQMLKDEEEAGE